MSKDKDLVYKIFENTHKGNVEWVRSDIRSTSLAVNDDVSGFPYATTINDIMFIVYEYQYRNYTDVDEWDIYDGVKLEIVEKDGTSLHVFESDDCKEWLYPLFKLAKYSAEKIGKKISIAFDALAKFDVNENLDKN